MTFLIIILNLLFPSLPNGLEYIHVNKDITALRIDPEHYEFEIAACDEWGPLSAPGWVFEEGFVAVTNAGMFDFDFKPVGMSKINGKVIKSHNVSSYKMVFAIGDKPRLIDLANEEFNKEEFHSYFQSIRMISSDGRNVWGKQEKKWSMACIAEDAEGRILFIHSRTPFPVHDFINQLQQSDLGIVKAMYLEGGPEASLYVKSGDFEAKHIGSYETGFNENDDNNEFWKIPNIIGVKPKITSK
jgi:hypothetical protein